MLIIALERFGDDTPRKPRPTYKSIKLEEHPMLTFTFKYRPFGELHVIFDLHRNLTSSTDVLQANGILPPLIETRRKVTEQPKEEHVSDDEFEVSDPKVAAEMRALEVSLQTLLSSPIVSKIISRKNFRLARPRSKLVQAGRASE